MRKRKNLKNLPCNPQSFGHGKAAESEWKKIGPCLDLSNKGKLYALLKQGGKQIRRCLETTDLVARTLDWHTERFQATLTGAHSTLDNDKCSLKKLLQDQTSFLAPEPALRRVWKVE